ncbi:methyltransferase domain-containing protein [Mesorhizobium sp. M1C.F.Ca.ET.193.01.1.1]|uniref:methyltransferase domain-containing protein n=1 Tax=unclassified Mesorhizobium TaxID=325217 RepID=UPI000FD21662|nr:MULTISPECIES: methyltransferase domain-containing protein [unclassified Mesorhizobium]TGS95832.1 methyltransferase domain-containing protein [bacterium M00.F.Ca.ET.177.01.1.1]TGQ51900.1 methyltransferase domain-containing protein [Mesorhizobium sp. M1C.F.Ca.ET.210.01.1.1]TGQ68144.1 methyltransferase domain-containing protein [Mesorhizobium sp. M1C.F.Ca.ET.212.01.1.1]TGR03423.1 methyltransferase domain-containing protein [Mesorhizobium sp. M1C.F.Ca.ET.204.01.1.1]TGR24040.1 methyltransferase 
MSALAQRSLVPEILDGLPADDARALASRRDLRRINALMFQAPIMASLMRKFLPKPPGSILEIGAGDGTFMLKVARRMASDWREVDLTMLDRAALVTPRLAADFAGLGWTLETITADVFDWAEEAQGRRFDAIAVNLFLHHFDDAGLLRLFSLLQCMAPLILATEPLRAGLALAATGLLAVIGANGVTRHDAAQSVRAGFRDSELSHLWSAAGGSPLEERRAGPFSHVFAGAAPAADAS